jgi:hypothetical protein
MWFSGGALRLFAEHHAAFIARALSVTTRKYPSIDLPLGLRFSLAAAAAFTANSVTHIGPPEMLV